MLVAVVVLGIVLVGAIALVIARSRALEANRAELTVRGARIAELEGELAAESSRAAHAEANVVEERARADAQAKRTAEATREAKDATAAANAATARADEAESVATAAVARAETAEAQVRVLPPAGLWALEAQRLARLWRERVSVVLDGTSPIEDAKDPALEAVRVLASASREESGVVVDVTWSVDPPPPAPLSVAVVRLAEELIATARLADGAELDVRTEAGELVLRLSTDSPIASPTALLAALRTAGWPTEVLGRTIVVRLPAP